MILDLPTKHVETWPPNMTRLACTAETCGAKCSLGAVVPRAPNFGQVEEPRSQTRCVCAIDATSLFCARHSSNGGSNWATHPMTPNTCVA